MRTSWKDAFSKSAFKAVICIAIVFMMTCTVLLSACSSNKQSESPTTSNVEKLTILGKETDLAKTYMKKIFEMYESQTGKKINLISVPDADFNDVVKKKFESKDYPDILMHFNNTLLSSLDIENNFEYLNNQPWVSDLTEAVVQYCTDDSGNLLGLPFWENSVSGCYYNKTILNSLGLKPASSQAEFDRLCAALKSIGRTPLYWGDSSCSWMYQFALDPIFVKNPELIEKLNSGEITYAEIPEVRDMIQWIADAFANGWVDMNKNGSTWDDMSGALNSGYAKEPFTWGNTETMWSQLQRLGFTRKPYTGGIEPRGAILLRPGHTAVACGNGMIAQASIDERGKISGGQSGDQTGRETNISKDPKNWQWVIYAPDYVPSSNSTITQQGGVKVRNYGTIKKGSSGRKVKILQCVLNEAASAGLAEDGIFGNATDSATRAWQRNNGLEVDGIVGKNTWASL